MGKELSRREFLIRTGSASAVMLSAGSLASMSRPKTVQAAKAKSEIEDVNEVIRETFGKRKVKMSGVEMDAPIIAENGGVVPIKITSDLPMEKDNYVKKMYFYVDKNLHPYTASVDLTPANGKAAFSFRIKMRQTSNVRAILETNKGELYGVNKVVKVTIGGCGG